jgi:O-antigen ligase
MRLGLSDNSQVERKVIQRCCTYMKRWLSIAGMVIISLAFAALISHYVAARFQSVRWPTQYYFVCALLIAVVLDEKKAIQCFIFSLPLISDFHLQLEALWTPSVKYFVAHPALDLVAGLAVGFWLKKVFIEKKLVAPAVSVNWIFGLFLVILSISVGIAIIRNLHESTRFDFNIFQHLEQLLSFKLINPRDDYWPAVDLINYSFAILTIALLVPILKKINISQREKIIFQPIIYSCIASAIWGIVQAFTSIGLSQITLDGKFDLDYRGHSLGFGAQGFQPDIHAFASIMLLGTVGILGLLVKMKGRDLAFCYISLTTCWFALILSKSKASIAFALVASFLYLLIFLKRKGRFESKVLNWLFGIIVCGVTLFLYFSQNLIWVDEIFRVMLLPARWSFDEFNWILKYRPEIFGAGFRMFSDAPLFGIGQGNFLRLSSNFDISQSLYLAKKGGDNAHNYFLQTLVETGLVGVTAFVLIIAWPIIKVTDFSKISTPITAIIALFLGNIFSHSLLVRPNLILLAVLLAMLYASLDCCKTKNLHRETS